MSFNGTTSRVTVADSAALHLSTAMTLEAWINPSGAGAPDSAGHHLQRLRQLHLIATLGANLPHRGRRTSAAGWPRRPAPARCPVNTWTHLAATYDGTTVRFFVNGTQVASQPATGVFDVSTNPLEIGGSLVDGGPFAGLIDDVRVYDTALTPAQIQTDMTTPVGTSDTQAPTAPPAWQQYQN